MSFKPESKGSVNTKLLLEKIHFAGNKCLRLDNKYDLLTYRIGFCKVLNFCIKFFWQDMGSVRRVVGHSWIWTSTCILTVPVMNKQTNISYINMWQLFQLNQHNCSLQLNQHTCSLQLKQHTCSL